MFIKKIITKGTIMKKLKTVSAGFARENLGKLLAQIKYFNSEIIIERKNKPAARLIPYKQTQTEKASAIDIAIEGKYDFRKSAGIAPGSIFQASTPPDTNNNPIISTSNE